MMKLAKELNLGEKLAATKIAIANAAAEKKAAEERAAAKQFEQDKNTIWNLFDSVSEKIEEDIENGMIPKGIKIPSGAPYNTYNWGNPRYNETGNPVPENHPHKSDFDAFFNWADENGLVAKFVSCHDGMGVKSWWEVQVEAK
jgi:hypothetical protein